jgi:hypothetical protein
MFKDYDDRLIAEEDWAEQFSYLTPEEQAEYYDRLEKQQQKEMDEDYWEKAFEWMRERNEAA